MKYHVLIIDDEEKLRTLLKRIITLEDYRVSDVATLSGAWQLLDSQPIDIVLCDVKLPDGNGVDFTKEIKNRYPCIEVILLTAYGNIADGVQAIKSGAFDYIVKGDDNDKIIPLLSRAGEKNALQKKVNRLEKQLNNKYSFENIIGDSPAIKNAIDLAAKVAPMETPVLLTGETGTGKEVFAQAIHYNSKRSKYPFVALNCSALSKELIESELFGHKAGAYTGAIKDKKGLIEEAKGGTLFLDEIGELPVDLQPKLLRFLENGTFYRVGENIEIKADVRLIAATNRELHKEIEIGHFRSDLYYRVAVFTIQLPSLRDRRKDIEKLAEHYLNVYSIKIGKPKQSLSSEALAAMRQYNWPGNVRELKNVIERAIILEDGNEIGFNCLPSEIQQYGSSPNNGSTVFQLATAEKLHIQKVLNYTGGNKTEAARLMDIGLATLYRKIEEYGLKSN